MTRACVIFNPTAKGEGARRALKRLHDLRSGCTLKPTMAAGDAGPLATEAVAQGYETVVAMGGDGTINEVINGLAAAPDAFARTRLGVLPVGTVNVFARELGIPFSFARAWEVICRGREVTIDLPNMEFQTRQGPQRRWFAQMAGCGLDARAVELMDWELKKRIGQYAYVVSGLKALRERRVTISVSSGSQTYTGELVLIGNGRLYGGPIPVFAQADLRDGLLDVCVFPKINAWVVLRYACAFVSPRFLIRGREQHLQTSAVSIDCPDHVPIELDGELVGEVPACCVMHKSVLRVIVP